MLIYGWIVTEMSAITSLKLSLALPFNKVVDDRAEVVFYILSHFEIWGHTQAALLQTSVADLINYVHFWSKR